MDVGEGTSEGSCRRKSCGLAHPPLHSGRRFVSYFPMQTGLKIVALGLAFGSLVFWFFGGPNFGWTRASGTEWMINPMTGGENEHGISHLLPGLDFLAMSWLVAVLLYGVSLRAGRRAWMASPVRSARGKSG
jgi:hypothetical protein